MAIKLTELTAIQRSLAIQYEGEEVMIQYTPGQVTMTVQARIQAAQSMSAGNANQELAEVLSSIITSWDIMGDDGKPVLVTPELIQMLPIRFVTALTFAIFEDVRPNALTGKR